MTKSKQEVGRAWQETRDTRKKIWREEHPRIQRKIQHLVRRSTNCAQHKNCRDLDKIWDEKVSRDMRIPQGH